MISNLLSSIRLIGDAAGAFTDNCVDGITYPLARRLEAHAGAAETPADAELVPQAMAAAELVV